MEDNKQAIIELVKKINQTDTKFLKQLRIIIEKHLRRGKH